MADDNTRADLPGMRNGHMHFAIAPWILWDAAAVVTGVVMVLLVPMERWQATALLTWDLALAAVGTVTVLSIQAVEKNRLTKATVTKPVGTPSVSKEV